MQWTEPAGKLSFVPEPARRRLGHWSDFRYAQANEGDDKMTVAFKDFAPNIEKQGFFKTTYESVQDCLRRANEWIQRENPDVINIETVVLPNLWDGGEEGTEDPELTASGEMFSSWHQFVRVWYKA
jgi:hypothetical protein